ncbi:hypothetical protein AB0L65_33270 [Nonomuraea sp. NPDC052116]|uniref:hypothetical protein n=1 Tax=Nonomuraea sp. NPDC052116 TaxID=3155665 RepID=UPI00342250F3
MTGKWTDRWRTIVNGHSAKSTFTKRTAERYAQYASDEGMAAHAERTNLCPTCGLHGCPGGQDCPDA